MVTRATLATITGSAAPVADREILYYIEVMHSKATGDLEYVELRIAPVKSTDPDATFDERHLRLYRSAQQFLDDYRADPVAAMEAARKTAVNELP